MPPLEEPTTFAGDPIVFASQGFLAMLRGFPARNLRGPAADPRTSPSSTSSSTSKKGITAEEVNAVFRRYATGSLDGVLAVCDEPLVSVNFRCTDVSSTIDSSLTMVMGDGMLKVVAWYDNEWGYSQRVVYLAHLVASKWPGAAGAAAEGYVDPL